MTSALSVFLTVDTEVWPFPGRDDLGTDGDSRRDLTAEIGVYVDGATDRGVYGLQYQLEVLGRHELQATYFVEPLFSLTGGIAPLRRIVELIQAGGQDVQLHLHPEWLRHANGSYRHHPLLFHYPEDEQAAIVRTGLDLLRQAGATDLCAFRAGNYGAGASTLRALARNGLTWDSSLNVPYLGGSCDLRTAEPLRQATRMEGVYELPITYFEDWPGHHRALQLGSCSFAEITAVLRLAARARWRSVVIVLHSFEMIRRPQGRSAPGIGRPAAVVIRRFERLCRFLDRHRDQFRTVTFRGLDPAALVGPQPARALRSHVGRTSWRYVEQLVGRLR
jgi:hypothetical protein